MIERAIATVLTPLSVSNDALTARVEVCERARGADDAVTALKADLVGLHKDVDELMSTDLSMLFGSVNIPDVLSSDIPACSEVPPATTGKEVRADDSVTKPEAKTNVEQLGVTDEGVYDDLPYLDGAMVPIAVQASSRDVSMVGSSGAKDVDTPGIDTQTKGVVDMHTSPQA
ncbi:hypothetical protein R3W88_014652 [Solanum pinnatisectum]|uniref:Polyprotein protein n=1 Tax=Solanum pinnatisectum TaxID=50273 RepID=A0AAV9KUQ3_9SOLN|nr:hypothetical protein R3W88_014652 [Solanum pinnatisectum]